MKLRKRHFILTFTLTITYKQYLTFNKWFTTHDTYVCLLMYLSTLITAPRKHLELVHEQLMYVIETHYNIDVILYDLKSS